MVSHLIADVKELLIESRFNFTFVFLLSLPLTVLLTVSSISISLFFLQDPHLFYIR